MYSLYVLDIEECADGITEHAWVGAYRSKGHAYALLDHGDSFTR